jgi:hypothetical protein
MPVRGGAAPRRWRAGWAVVLPRVSSALCQRQGAKIGLGAHHWSVTQPHRARWRTPRLRSR